MVLQGQVAAWVAARAVVAAAAVWEVAARNRSCKHPDNVRAEYEAAAAFQLLADMLVELRHPTLVLPKGHGKRRDWTVIVPAGS